MSRRSRILAFGSAGVLVLAGAICAATVGGVTGQILTMALMLAGLGGAVLLLFLEVGLSEDREQSRKTSISPSERSTAAFLAGRAGAAGCRDAVHDKPHLPAAARRRPR